MHNPLDQTNPQASAGGDDLRRLPTELPPPYNWQEFRRRSELQAVAAKGLGWGHMAAAAALLAVVIGIAIWSRVGTGGRHTVADEGTSAQAQRAARQLHGAGRSTGALPAGDLDALREAQTPDDQAH